MKTSNRSWKSALKQALKTLPAQANKPPRVAILGMGNELNGDDAAGVLVARGLLASGNQVPTLLVIDAGLAPENFTGTLRRFRPDIIFLVDAAHFSARPGDVRCLDWHVASGFSASTHTLPVNVLAEYLTTELNCELSLIAIQIQSTEYGTPVSEPVFEAVQNVLKGLNDTFVV